MNNFKKIQSQNLAVGFNVTSKFDKNLLQNVSLQSRANIFFENNCTVSFLLSFMLGLQIDNGF